MRCLNLKQATGLNGGKKMNKFSAPIFLAEDIQAILDTNLQNERLDKTFVDIKNYLDYLLLYETPKNARAEKALRDISNDVDNMQEMIRVISKWVVGDYSDQTLISGWNIYCKNRGIVRYGE